MKYALLVAMALLGACASDAETVDEAAPNTSASPERQAPVDSTVPIETTDIVTDAGPGLLEDTQAQLAPGAVPGLAPASGLVGSWAMAPQTDSNKPQPQPWFPTDEGSSAVTDPTAPEQVRKSR